MLLQHKFTHVANHFDVSVCDIRKQEAGDRREVNALYNYGTRARQSTALLAHPGQRVDPPPRIAASLSWQGFDASTHSLVDRTGHQK